MPDTARFYIKRTDGLTTVDETVLESEGLTIGRAPGNDLILNQREVSRTHAGIKRIGDLYWLFNLSESNGSWVNGQLVDSLPLAEGDIVHIGRYNLVVGYAEDGLRITVEMDPSTQLIAPTELPPPPAPDMPVDEKTVFLQMPTAQPEMTMASRMQATRFGTGIFGEFDQEALDLFWEKRKREAGKIGEKTPLHPRGDRKVGKAQWNWRPTLDLRKLWRKSYFAWGAALVVLFSLVAFLLYEEAYSPADLADPHARVLTRQELRVRNVASRENDGSCANCHGITGMYDRCVECHKTSRLSDPKSGVRAAFIPQTLIKGHVDAGVTDCTSCHAEHQGPKASVGLLDYSLCIDCHNGRYVIKEGRNAGFVLRVPHGGQVGYPKVNGVWRWKGRTAAQWQRSLDRWEIKELGKRFTAQQLAKMPARNDKNASEDQFHRVHYLGKLKDSKACVVCHFTRQGTLDVTFKLESTREACVKCHAVDYRAGGLGTAAAANCITCHKQHPVVDVRAVPAANMASADTLRDVSKVLDSVTNSPSGIVGGSAAAITRDSVGGSDVGRQNRGALTLATIGYVGGAPWYFWLGLGSVLAFLGLVYVGRDTFSDRSFLQSVKIQEEEDKASASMTGFLDLERLKSEGPAFPHPVINQETCIGCHACVDACPHDVLAIVNGKSTVVAIDQCMEDTSCQVECPTNPKSCVVINTTKKIPPRKVPVRDRRFKTNVEGVYLIGDVSGTPLIKNAINEGRQVIDAIKEDLQQEGPRPDVEYDVAIIGVGPAGLSATVLAKQEGLKYVALEQDQLVSTIQSYQAGKYVFFTPPDKPVLGGIPLPGVGDTKENMLQGWFDAMLKNGVEIRESEGCKDIKQDNGAFLVISEKDKAKNNYRVRKVLLAIGNRGAPIRLGVKGEDLRVKITPKPAIVAKCPDCGAKRKEEMTACWICGRELPVITPAAFEADKVQYKLSDPKEFLDYKCMVVGAGNSAIEVAVGLTGFERRGDSISFRGQNQVVLIVRSDFKGDLNLRNKMDVYDCIDSGRIKAFFGCTIKEITDGEVVIMSARSKEEKARVPNDFVFALIGGEKPTKFLESVGVKIGSEKV